MYATFGPEGYLRRVFRSALAGRIAPGPAAAWNLTVVDGATARPDDIRGQLETASFFGDGRLVVVLEPPGLAAGRRRDAVGAADGGDDDGGGDPGGGAEAGPAGPPPGGDWAAVVQAVPAHATLLLETPADRLDGRTRLGRAVKAVATCVECAPLTAADAVRWVRSELARRRRAAAPDWAWALVGRVGTDLFRLRSELDKVVAYAGGRDRLEPGDLGVTSAAGDDTVFDLVDAIGGGEAGRALALARSLVGRGAAPLSLLALIARQVRMIWAAREAGPVDDRRLAEALGVPPFVAKKYRAQGARFGSPELEAALVRLADADRAIKTGRMEPVLALELVVAELAGGVPAAAGPAGA